jgi:hypothetical protein
MSGRLADAVPEGINEADFKPLKALAQGWKPKAGESRWAQYLGFEVQEGKRKGSTPYKLHQFTNLASGLTFSASGYALSEVLAFVPIGTKLKLTGGDMIETNSGNRMRTLGVLLPASIQAEVDAKLLAARDKRFAARDRN